MKCFLVCLLISLRAIVASAQTTAPQTNPDVSVVKFSWSKERIGWQRDPFSGPIENFDEMRVRARNEKRITDAKKGGNSAEVDRLSRDAKSDDALISEIHKNAPARYVFVYKASVKNTTAKTISSIDWDYIFLDRADQSEIGRQQFTNDEKIGPGKSKELSIVVNKPPTQTISVTSLNTKERDGLIGHVVIVRLKFTDGTEWQQPQ